MIRAMPMQILIHTVEYKEYVGEGRYGKEYKDGVTLDNVLVQPVSSLGKTTLVDVERFNSLMFFDCSNSTPSGTTFTKGSLITFGGEEMEIEEVVPVYAFDLHHYELGLV